ncbi:MAG: DUF4125 family protein [Lachnospiraceae bacterium]
MEIQSKLQELDVLFQKKKIDEVGIFLKKSIKEAREEQDSSSLITLLNEIIGYCRDTGKYDEAAVYSREVLAVMQKEGLAGTIPYATTLLNIANADRAAGRLEESLKLYRQVLSVYDGVIERTDYRYAALYNNLSLLYQEMGDFVKAVETLEEALSIISLYKEERIALAVTHTNLASSLLRIDRDEEAALHLKEAFTIFEQDEEKDYHYSAALAVMGEAEFRAERYEPAAEYYERALAELESHVGKTPGYETIKENLEQVYKKLDVNKKPVEGKKSSGLALCEQFYETYGRQMIREKFPDYESHIAVGLVGEGSDCFGFDDQYSGDHDFGPGFCMWLNEEDFSRIGERLGAAYEALPVTFQGITRITTPRSQGRTGVFSISGFYGSLLAVNTMPETEDQWFAIEEWRLASAVNGKVFRDDAGEFTEIRERLCAYYPETVWKKKIAAELFTMAQLGQYNYERMLKRGEKVTAEIILSDYMKHTMQLIYLLNRRYAPYYKWLHRGMAELSHLPEIMDILQAMYDMPKGDERIPMTIEIIAALIIGKLRELGLAEREEVSPETYLEVYADSLLTSKESMDAKRKALIEKLIHLEWTAFDKVKNEGGRADCQDDWQTFSIMRMSQYETWKDAMLRAYISDFEAAQAAGWNLIAEKYGRMEESTAPDQYAKIKDKLPALSKEKKQIIEEIVHVQVSWMDDFARRYPKTAKTARSIHTYEDNLYHTSFETYLRGELGTYSDQTLLLYGSFIAEIAREGKNLAELINENIARAYGYLSLKDLETKLQ